MSSKCLFCCQPVTDGSDFHKKCSKAFFGIYPPPVIPHSIDQMTELAQMVVERSISVPGVQPKLSMSLLKDSQTNSPVRLTVVGALGGNFILKPPSDIFREMPQNEHATMLLAQAFGIPVVPFSLTRLSSGELSYITRRIDRTADGRKIHLLDMFQITEATDKYRSSMEKIAKAIHTYSMNTLLDSVFFFELCLFCFLTGNNDMHLKNFSMIETVNGWVLAPAYDLLNVTIVLPEDTEEMALTLQGKKNKIKLDDFIQLGKKMELTDKQIERVCNKLLRNKAQAFELIDNSFLSDEMKEAYKHVLASRYERLQLL